MAYCLDDAIDFFGQWVISELDKVSDKSKNPKRVEKMKQARLEALLSGKKAKMFADPAAKFASTKKA